MATSTIPTRHAALALTLLVLAGCGPMSTAPMLDDSARIDNNGAATQASTMPIDTPAETPGGGSTPSVTPPPPDLVGTSYEMSSTQGGTMKSGRWTVVVPPGAFEGTARVAISTSSSKSWQCQLGILPASKNNFETMVTLVADCHSVIPKQLARYAIFQLDEGTGAWVRVPDSIVDLKKKTVTAPIPHFSTYKVALDHGPLTP